LERVGVDRYSRPGKFGLDTVLQQYLPATGFFLEAGAMNGFTESNTYYLEKFRGWSGILIEPVPAFCDACRRRRTKSTVIHAALVANGYSEPTVRMRFANAMSMVVGAMPREQEQRHLANAERCGVDRFDEFDVPARTLTSVLEDARSPRINFFSLDVEGYEMQVLEGLDLHRFRPDWILVECLSDDSKTAMRNYLTAREYAFVAQVTPRDLLFRIGDASELGGNARTGVSASQREPSGACEPGVRQSRGT
jgi:FkbM family methyltransferase